MFYDTSLCFLNLDYTHIYTNPDQKDHCIAFSKCMKACEWTGTLLPTAAVNLVTWVNIFWTFVQNSMNTWHSDIGKQNNHNIRTLKCNKNLWMSASFCVEDISSTHMAHISYMLPGYWLPHTTNMSYVITDKLYCVFARLRERILFSILYNKWTVSLSLRTYNCSKSDSKYNEDLIAEERSRPIINAASRWTLLNKSDSWNVQPNISSQAK